MAHSLAESACKEYGTALHRYLMRRLANAQRAQDLAQETYLRLVRMDHAELVRAPQAYVFRIASNLVYEFQLRERRDPVSFDSRMADCAAERVSEPHALEPDEPMDEQQRLEYILAQLPPLYATMVVMKKRDGKTMKEIAGELGLSVHTVKKYLWRAVARARAACLEIRT